MVNWREVERLTKKKKIITLCSKQSWGIIEGIFHSIYQNRKSFEQQIENRNQMFTDQSQRIKASLVELRNLFLSKKQTTADWTAQIRKIWVKKQNEAKFHHLCIQM